MSTIGHNSGSLEFEALSRERDEYRRRAEISEQLAETYRGERDHFQAQMRRVSTLLDSDLSAAQKCMGARIIASADATGEAVLPTKSLLRAASSVTRMLATDGVRALRDVGLIAAESRASGRARVYQLLDESVLEEAVNAIRARRLDEPDPTSENAASDDRNCSNSYHLLNSEVADKPAQLNPEMPEVIENLSLKESLKCKKNYHLSPNCSNFYHLAEAGQKEKSPHTPLKEKLPVSNLEILGVDSFARTADFSIGTASLDDVTPAAPIEATSDEPAAPIVTVEPGSVEAGPAEAGRVSRRTGARGTRLASDWELPEDWLTEAVADTGLDADTVRREGDRFRDHWISTTGRAATKLDWRATWRNWCRSARDRLRRRPSVNDDDMIGYRFQFANGSQVLTRGDLRQLVSEGAGDGLTRQNVYSACLEIEPQLLRASLRPKRQLLDMVRREALTRVVFPTAAAPEAKRDTLADLYGDYACAGGAQ